MVGAATTGAGVGAGFLATGAATGGFTGAAIGDGAGDEGAAGAGGGAGDCPLPASTGLPMGAATGGEPTTGEGLGVAGAPTTGVWATGEGTWFGLGVVVCPEGAGPEDTAVPESSLPPPPQAARISVSRHAGLFIGVPLVCVL